MYFCIIFIRCVEHGSCFPMNPLGPFYHSRHFSWLRFILASSNPHGQEALWRTVLIIPEQPCLHLPRAGDAWELTSPLMCPQANECYGSTETQQIAPRGEDRLKGATFTLQSFPRGQAEVGTVLPSCFPKKPFVHDSLEHKSSSLRLFWKPLRVNIQL